MGKYAYLTVSEAATYEAEKIKGSRFIAFSFPVASESDLLPCFEQVKKLHPSAGHHCYAWQLGGAEGPFRVSDDGEPSGTGGPPILRMMQGREISDALVIVVRYFGGTKLGKGGLIRAYGGTAGALLDSLTLEPVLATQILTLHFDYTFSALVQSIITSHSGEIISSEYGASVDLSIRFLDEHVSEFKSEILERSAGRIQAQDA